MSDDADADSASSYGGLAFESDQSVPVRAARQLSGSSTVTPTTARLYQALRRRISNPSTVEYLAQNGLQYDEESGGTLV